LKLTPVGTEETNAKAELTTYHTTTFKPALDGEEYAKCKGFLPTLTAKVDAVLNVQVTQAKNKAQLVIAKTTPDEKSDGALDLIKGLDPVILGGLDAETKLGLLGALSAAHDLGRSNKANKDQPKRKALRALYGSMELDETFKKEDDAKRK